MTLGSTCPMRACRLCGGTTYTPVFYLDETEFSKCNTCGLIQISSAISLEDLKRYYENLGKQPIIPRARFDEQRIKRGSKFRVRYFQKYTGLKSGTVLEVGSAGGDFLALLKEGGFQVLGIEPSAAAEQNYQTKGLPLINDILENANLPEAHFDAICMFQVFEHFEDPKEAAKIFQAKLKRGGYLVIEIPDIHSIGAKFEKSPYKLFKREHVTYFSSEILNDLFRSLGIFRVYEHHYDYDAFRLPLGHSLKKIFYPLINPKFDGLLEKILNQEIDIHYRTAATMGATDKKSPGGHSRGIFNKSSRKILTAPLDIFFGYCAYVMDRGASLYWIGIKN